MGFYGTIKDFWLEMLEEGSYDQAWPDGLAPNAIENTLSGFIEGLEEIIDEGGEYLQSSGDNSWDIPPELALKTAEEVKVIEKGILNGAYIKTHDLRKLRKLRSLELGNPDEDPDTLLDEALEKWFDGRGLIKDRYEYTDCDTLDNRVASFGSLVLMHGILKREGFLQEVWLTEMREKVELLGMEKMLKWSKLHIPPRSASYLDRAIDCYMKDIGLDVIAIMCRAALDSAIEETISQEDLIKHYGSEAENPRKHISFGLRYIRDTGVLDSEGVDTLYKIRAIGSSVVHNIPSVVPHIKTKKSELDKRLAEPTLSLIDATAEILWYQVSKGREGYDKFIGPTFSVIGLIASGAGYTQDGD